MQINFEQYCDLLTGLTFRSHRNEGSFSIWTGYRHGIGKIEIWQGLTSDNCWILAA